jgi:hypothetical protein
MTTEDGRATHDIIPHQLTQINIAFGPYALSKGAGTTWPGTLLRHSRATVNTMEATEPAIVLLPQMSRWASDTLPCYCCDQRREPVSDRDSQNESFLEYPQSLPYPIPSYLSLREDPQRIQLRLGGCCELRSDLDRQA